MIDELCVYKPVVTVIAQHDVVPHEVEQGHLSQVDDVIGIAVNLIAIVVEVIERGIKERAEGDAQDSVDYGSSCVGVPANGNHGAIPCEERGTIGTCGRGQGATPTPGVVGVVPVEVVVVVVTGIVIVVVVVVAMMTVSAMSTVTSVSTIAAVSTIASVSTVTAVVSVAARGAIATIGLATLVAVSVTTAVVASIGPSTRGHVTATITSARLAAITTFAIVHGGRGGAAIALVKVSALASAVDVYAGIIALAGHSSRYATVVAAVAAAAAVYSSAAGA